MNMRKTTKVVCVTNTLLDGSNYPELIIGEIYEVVAKTQQYKSEKILYYLLNQTDDRLNSYLWEDYFFISLAEHRDKQLDELLND